MKAPNRSLLSVMTSCIAAVEACSSAVAPRMESDRAPPLTSLVRPARTQAANAIHRPAPSGPRDPGEPALTTIDGLVGLRRQWIAAEGVGNVGDGLLGLHAVAGVVQGRRDHGDPELARGDGNEAAAHAALA